jgi:hypothetical protein
MKVKIGKYKNYFGAYQIAQMLCFWVPKVEDEYGFKRSRDWVHNFGNWLDGNDKRYSWLSRFCQWVDGKRKRTVKIHIDPWDSWNADETLAMIILPVLKQLRANTHGSGFVDDEDVPDSLKRSSAPATEHEWDIDDNWHKRWGWVLGEMICAFEIVLEKESFVLDEETAKRRDNGLRLFGKYYMGLWD